jgi:hypothetical protein
MENVGIFYGHLVYFIAIWYTLWPFGILYSHLVYFIDIWYTLWPFGILYSHLVYFIAIWYTLLPFIIMYVWPFGVVCGPCGIFFPFWYVWTKKHLATLITYVSSAPTSLDLEIDSRTPAFDHSVATVAHQFFCDSNGLDRFFSLTRST